MSNDYFLLPEAVAVRLLCLISGEKSFDSIGGDRLNDFQNILAISISIVLHPDISVIFLDWLPLEGALVIE